MLKKAVQQGRSERRPEAYPLGYVEDLNDARTMLAGFFSILLGSVACVDANIVERQIGRPDVGFVAALS
jgi:hypothetical protein